MNFEDDEEWDLDLIDDLVRKEEEAIAAKRTSQAVPPTLPVPSLSLQPFLRSGTAEASTLSGTTSNYVAHARQVSSITVGASNKFSSISHRSSIPPYIRSSSRDLTGLGTSWAEAPNFPQAHNCAIVHNSGNGASTSRFSSSRVAGATNITPSIQATFSAKNNGVPAERTQAYINSTGSFSKSSTATVEQNKFGSYGDNSQGHSQYSEGHLTLRKPTLPREDTEAHKQRHSVLDTCTVDQQPGGSLFQDALAEKENIIREMQSRLIQADKELIELRRKIAFAETTPLNSEQRESERLSTQLLFKDHEVLEVRRACDEKAEQLKRALEEAAQLRKDNDALKRLRQAKAVREVEYKDRGKHESLAAIGHFSQPDTTVITGGSGKKMIAGQSVLGLRNDCHKHETENEDLWSPPWTTGKEMGVPNDGAMPENVSELGPVQSQKIPLYQEDPSKPSMAAEFKARTADRGCTSAIQMGKSSTRCIDEVQELPCRETTALPQARRELESTKASRKGPVKGRENKENSHFGSRNLPHELVGIWTLESPKENGLRLISKLFAACRADLYLLLTNGLNNIFSSKEVSDRISSDLFALLDETRQRFVERSSSEYIARNVGCVQGHGAALKLHLVLTQMANGLASSDNLFAALLEFCNSESVEVVQSALHVLRCILIHDPKCRDELFGRSLQWNKTGCFPGFDNVREETGKVGATAESIPKYLMDQYFSRTPKNPPPSYFSSPTRVIYQTQGVGRPVCPIKAKELVQELKNVPEIAEAEQSGVRGLADRFDPGHGDVNSRPHIFFRWVLHVALKSTSTAVKFEAVGMMNLLVMQTEPMIQRKMFGSILFEERIGALLKWNAGVDVRLQAVRLVHHLLHCPVVLNRFCDVDDLQVAISGSVSRLANNDDSCLDKEGVEVGKGQEGCSSEREHSIIPIQGGISNQERKCTENKREVLEGLISCLFSTGNDLQEYALRRSVIRVLAFIATSGNNGAAALMAIKCHQNIACNDEGKHNIETTIEAFLIPAHLVSLLDTELRAQEEEEGSSSTAVAEERESLIREALTLLCRLASHSTQSPVVLTSLTAYKRTVRLCLSVANNLISKGFRSMNSKSDRKSLISPIDMIELAKGLRRRILASMPN